MTLAEDALIDELIAEPSLERYLVYADLLQTRGDPRGELIALEVHAQKTGVRDPRAQELQSAIEGQLVAELGARDGVKLGWELGFVRELVVWPMLAPAVIDRLGGDAFALVRSFAVSYSAAVTPAPIEDLVRSPIARTLERVTFGSTGLAPSAELIACACQLPRLRGLEVTGMGAPSREVLAQLAACERLEELALWMTTSDTVIETLIETTWPGLRGLVVTGPGMGRSELPPYLVPLLDGTRHPALTTLGFANAGFQRALLDVLTLRPLGRRLRRLGLNWRYIDDDTLEPLEEAMAEIELFVPRPTGRKPTANEEYELARRLRLGLDRDRVAEVHARRATEIDGSNYYHWTELGYVLGALDRLPDKIAAMEQASLLDPKRWGAYAGRGAAFRDLNRFAESEAMYQKAIAADPTMQVHNGLGLLYTRMGRGEEAIASFDRAAEKATTPGDLACYATNAIEVLVEEGRLAEALARHARAIEAAPDDARLRRTGGLLQLAAGNAAAALATAPDVRELPAEPDYPSIALRAAAQRDLGHIADAERLYGLIASGTNCPAWIAFAWLGQTTLGRGDPLGAIAEADPLVLADAIATAVNATRTTTKVHDTIDRANDRIHVAVAAIAAACATGRLADARAGATALADYLDGPAPVKSIDWWHELAELMSRVARRASPDAAQLVRTAYRVATGREPTTALR